MTRPLAPLDALHAAVLAAMLTTAPRRPGALIQRLPMEIREALARLTSDDAGKLRCDLQTTQPSK